MREHRAGLVRSGDVVRTKILLGATLLIVVLAWLLWPASAPAHAPRMHMNIALRSAARNAFALEQPSMRMTPRFCRCESA